MDAPFPKTHLSRTIYGVNYCFETTLYEVVTVWLQFQFQGYNKVAQACDNIATSL